MTNAALKYQADEEIRYNLIPTIQAFHECPAQLRAIVGPVGSGKTTGATWEICHFLPFFMYRTYGIKKTRWVVVRNTSIELRDTTLATVMEWFDFGNYRVQAMILNLEYPGDNEDKIEVEILFRACDNEKHVRQFKSLEVTGYWIDESIEVSDNTKKMLKNRIGRYPRKSPVRFGIETTNPPDIEHTMYSQFKWTTPPPGPLPSTPPLENHVGFWQPPFENIANLRPGYYDDLKKDYADNPDWADMYILGKPGQLVKGKLVYSNFNRHVHVADNELEWGGQKLYRGWDNSGNTPACIVLCPVSPQRMHIFKEFHTTVENIVDFTRRVVENCNESYPGSIFVDFGDPAGGNRFSTKEGDFTSNADLMASECGVVVIPSQQNMLVRINCVDQALLKRDGILIDPRCTRLINGFLGGYHYPELRGMPGVYKREVEKNKFSHCFDGRTLISMDRGVRGIKDIVVGDLVATPLGNKRVTATMRSVSNKRLKLTFSNGKTLVCTEDHPFFTESSGLVLADALQYDNVLLSINTKQGEKRWADLLYTRSKSSTASGTIRNQKVIIKPTTACLGRQGTCTETYGSLRMVKSLKATASTMLTRISRTIFSPILSLRHSANIYQITGTNGLSVTLVQPGSICSNMLSQLQQNGMEVKQGWNGIKSMGSKPGSIERSYPLSVSSAIESICTLKGHVRKVSALLRAKVKPVVTLASTIYRLPALFAGRCLRRISTQNNGHAQETVAKSTALKLTNKEYLKEPDYVYDLTVEDAHCFYAEGILASNCHDALQYALAMLHVSASPPVDERELYPDEEYEATY